MRKASAQCGRVGKSVPAIYDAIYPQIAVYTTSTENSLQKYQSWVFSWWEKFAKKKVLLKSYETSYETQLYHPKHMLQMRTLVPEPGPCLNIRKDVFIVRSREVSKPRDWYFKLSYRFEIWQAHRQQCSRSACQISEWSDISKYKSRSFETSRDLTIRRLFGYWDEAQVSRTCISNYIQQETW